MKASKENVKENVPSIAAAELHGHEGAVLAVRFTSDGKYVLTSGQDRTIRLWNPTKKDPAHNSSSLLVKEHELNHSRGLIPHALPIQVYKEGHTHPISAIDIDDKSSTIVSSSAQILVVTDAITKKIKRRLHGHSGRINAVACSSEAETFLSASYDGTVRIWDGRSRSHDPIQILSEAKDSVSSMKVVQNKAMTEIITGSVDGKVRTYDLRKGELRCDDFGSQAVVTNLALTSDDLCLAAACLDGNVHIVARSNGEILQSISTSSSLSQPYQQTKGQYAIGCDITADNSYLISGSEDGISFMFDLVQGTLQQSFTGHTRPTCSVACHPELNSSSIAITASYDSRAIVWANPRDLYRWQT
jgi:mitogen-activated protein kinase organizer 1